MERILISACLLGRPVRYDGRGKALAHHLLERWKAEDRLVPVCPEVIAGFPTPRPPAEFEPGANGETVLDGRARVFENTGQDVTAQFLNGADAALRIARENGCRFALLTDGSPSCGSGIVYGGRFDGRTVAGEGVAAALLRRHGVSVFSEGRIEELAQALARATVG